MRLFIAEKPSLARAIADALPGPQRKHGGYIECGSNDIVAWCAGHILELADADAYSTDYKHWALEHLPIIPREWKMVVKSADLLKTIRGLLPRADRVVHAGDPDREGQLLVDEVLDYLDYRGPVDRVRINDLNNPAVRKALAELENNAKYHPLSQAAQARQRADWLYGINLTRLYTLLGRAGGHDGVLSVGRVQTPLLGLVVRRDIEIEGFVPKPYFLLRAAIIAGGASFTATWVPGDASAQFLDDAGRLMSREHALSLQSRTTGAAGVVARATRDKKTEQAPLPYSLSDLQVDASRRLGLTAKDVLDCCQALYETHRLTTYPRSDCAHLPEGHFTTARSVLDAIAKNAPTLAPLTAATDPARRSRAWNDAKVTAHHAIVPTTASRSVAQLSVAERGVYDLICRRYIAQFYPPFEYHQTTIDLLVTGELFRATGRTPIADGWKPVFGAETDDQADTVDPADGELSTAPLPSLQQGASVRAGPPVTIIDRKTTPPKRFTDATLIQAMKGIARFVVDPAIKNLLHETDGIGTPATQAAIIQTLYDRRFIEKQRSHIVSTVVGRALISTLPAVATTPDMTALWEAALRRISQGEMPSLAFLQRVRDQLVELVTRGRAVGALSVPGVSLRPCPAPGCTGSLRQRRGKTESFWACTRYPDCKFTENGTPPTTANANPSSRPSRRARRSRAARP